MTRRITIAEMWRGESEQPAYKRQLGAVESSTNIRFGLLDGASKRNYTDILADISTVLLDGGLSATDNYLWVGMRQFLFVIGNGVIRCFDLTDGSSLEIEADEITEGGISYDVGAESANSYSWEFDYINTTPDNLDVTVAFDTLVIVNKTVTIESGYTSSFQSSLDSIIDGLQVDDPSAPEATATFVEPVDSYDDLIELIEPVSFRTQTDIGSPYPPYDWAEGDELEIKGQGNNSYDPQRWGVFDRFETKDDDDHVYIVLSDWYDENGNAVRIPNGGYAHNGGESIRFAKPHGQGKRSKRANDGEVYRTKLDFGADPAGYYIFYKGNQLQGTWYRIPASHIGDQQGTDETSATGKDEKKSREGKLTASTMPIRVVLDEDDSVPYIAVGLIPWSERLSGDFESNPKSDIVDAKIQAVEFHHSRLFQLVEDVVCASRGNDSWNMWIDNIGNIVDEDRIIMDINARNVGKVLYTDVVGSGLFIRCQSGQLEFHSGEEALTSTNGRIRQVGDFKDIGVPMRGTGAGIALLDHNNKVHQFTWGDARTGIQYSGVLNDHVPNILSDETVSGIYVIEKNTFFMDG